MINKVILILMVAGFSWTMSMEKSKNIISSKLIYTDHALKRMEERNITKEEINHVLQTGYRSWEDEDRGTERFTERKNKKNPLIVVLNRNEDPNVVVTVFRNDSVSQETSTKRGFPAGRRKEAAYLKEQKVKKDKDLDKELKRNPKK